MVHSMYTYFRNKSYNLTFICMYMYVMLIHVGGNAVIKAQVLAGGRGKGHFESGLQGGVKLASRFDVNTTGVHHLLNTYMYCTCINCL